MLGYDAAVDVEQLGHLPPGELERPVEVAHLDGIDVELCGWWSWGGGETCCYRKELKEAGCMFSRSKRRWHHAEDGRPFSRSSYSMSEIRSAYGSERFERRDEEEGKMLSGCS